jgi:multidrug efflux pump
VIVAYKQGAPIRLGDVADVSTSVEDVRTGGLADGKRAVAIVLFRQPGANMIETVDRVYELLPTLRASIPPSIKLAVALDRTTSIRPPSRTSS